MTTPTEIAEVLERLMENVDCFCPSAPSHRRDCTAGADKKEARRLAAILRVNAEPRQHMCSLAGKLSFHSGRIGEDCGEVLPLYAFDKEPER